MVDTRIYCEACDASAAVRLGTTQYFAAASDEDNVLRVFDRDRAGMPVTRLDVTAFLRPDDPEHTEADLEGAALLKHRIYWIASHGRNSKGKVRKMRHRFFATSVDFEDKRPELATVGVPYTELLADLAAAEALRRFGLEEAATLAPEAEGGLSIEGLASTPAGDLLLGFRNPVPEGRALIVRLTNPAEVVDGKERARLELAGHLDLGGRGIRAIEYVTATRSYLIVAGSFDDTRSFALFEWKGEPASPAVRLQAEGLDDVNPEELMMVGVYPMGILLDLFSDDGTKVCKGVAVERRTFRGTTIPLEI